MLNFESKGLPRERLHRGEGSETKAQQIPPFRYLLFISCQSTPYVCDRELSQSRHVLRMVTDAGTTVDRCTEAPLLAYTLTKNRVMGETLRQIRYLSNMCGS